MSNANTAQIADPPYVFHYNRHYRTLSEDHETLLGALGAWEYGEDYGELSGESITFEGKTIVDRNDFGQVWGDIRDDHPVVLLAQRLAARLSR